MIPTTALFALTLAAAAPPLSVVVDPGHGLPGNDGATTVLCEKEADVMLDLGLDLARRLAAEPRLAVHLTRTTSVGPSYRDRRALAAVKRAAAVLSLHLDTRGHAEAVRTSSGAVCLHTEDHRGVSILYADRHGDAPLLAGRRALARALARHLAAEGFAMYGGEDYAGLYETDPVPGVFIDRRGLFFLRRFAQPSVIIETHQGLSRTERAEWREDATRARFARAVIRALTDIAGRAPPGAKLLAEPVR